MNFNLKLLDYPFNRWDVSSLTPHQKNSICDTIKPFNNVKGGSLNHSFNTQRSIFNHIKKLFKRCFRYTTLHIEYPYKKKTA